MSSLITDAHKALLVADFSQLVDTYVRPLVAYHESARIVVVANPDFNRLNRFDQNTTSIQNLPVPKTINARIQYEANMDDPYGQVQQARGDYNQFKLKMAQGLVRIKVDKAGFIFIGDVKQVQIDDNVFNLVSSERPHGLFGIDYYTLWLQRLP